MNLLLLEPDEFRDGDRIRLTGRRARHLRTVLRVEPGQRLRLGVVDGPVGEGIVWAVEGEDVVLDCTLSSTVPSVPSVDLLLALPRPKVLQRLWAQFAALGVGRIVLTNAERVERHYFDTHVVEPETYRALLVEGLQQARDTCLPRVSIHRQFRILIEDELDGLCPQRGRFVAEPGPGPSLRQAVATQTNPGDRLLLAVGPEGGWNAFELRLLESRGFHVVSLGERTLRTDTACIALLAVARDALSTGETEVRRNAAKTLRDGRA